MQPSEAVLLRAWGCEGCQRKSYPLLFCVQLYVFWRVNLWDFALTAGAKFNRGLVCAAMPVLRLAELLCEKKRDEARWSAGHRHQRNLRLMRASSAAIVQRTLLVDAVRCEDSQRCVMMCGGISVNTERDK
jgi:hypothetical protein